MKKKIKFALLGASKISLKHIEALDNLKEFCEIVDVCDIKKESLKKISNLTQATQHLSVDEMLDKSSADCIIVSTPNSLHETHSLKAASKGFNVVCEKPISINILSAEKMLKSFENFKKKLFVVKQLRFLEGIKVLKKAISEKRFGKIYFIGVNIFWTRPQSYYDESTWRGTKQMDGGGALMNQTIHFFDLISYLFGEIKEIYSHNATLAREIEVEDTSASTLKFVNGAIGSFNVSLLTYPKNLDTSITIIGEKGNVIMGGENFNSFKSWEFKDKKEYDPNLFQDLSLISPHTYFFKDVIDSLKGDKIQNISIEEAIKSLKIVLASYDSTKNKRPVEIV